jgi:hypothetical protein
MKNIIIKTLANVITTLVIFFLTTAAVHWVLDHPSDAATIFSYNNLGPVALGTSLGVAASSLLSFGFDHLLNKIHNTKTNATQS